MTQLQARNFLNRTIKDAKLHDGNVQELVLTFTDGYKITITGDPILEIETVIPTETTQETYGTH